MNINKIISQLNHTKDTIISLVKDTTQEQAAWKPSTDRWTVLEVLNHLIDIEVEDFRHIIDLVLHKPEEKWPSFDEIAWITLRKYNEREIENSIKNFMTERDKSLAWLRELKELNIDAIHSGNGFKGKKMTAGYILVSWLGHDLFHIRQLTLLNWDILSKWSKPYSPEYSGFFI